MSAGEKLRHMTAELKGHVPFTVLGALLGIVFMLVFSRTGIVSSRVLFSVFHPSHVVLSAMVTAAMFGLHQSKRRFVLVLLVGYFGSIGIATVSDIVIPHLGGQILGIDVPTHGDLHADEHVEHEGHGHEGHEHEEGIHLGFIEEWYIVNPAALLGILIAFFLPRTKFPHAAHVLISTWASSSYMLMNMDGGLTAAIWAGVFVTLFIAIWVPCCVSDIVFPLLFVRSDVELTGACPNHSLHSHPHSDMEGQK
jgi:hypothetical protein